jgi:hypothetical protein
MLLASARRLWFRFPSQSLPVSSTEFIIQRTRSRREGGGTSPLGTVAELVALFRRMNTAPDRPGSIELFGPGVRVEFNVEGGVKATTPEDIVASIRLQVLETELFDLLIGGTKFESPGKLAATIRQNGWTLVNIETGFCYPQQRDDDDDEDGQNEDDHGEHDHGEDDHGEDDHGERSDGEERAGARKADGDA